MNLNNELKQIEEIANFADPGAKLVLTCAANPLEPGLFSNRGVVQAYPFRMLEDET